MRGSSNNHPSKCARLSSTYTTRGAWTRSAKRRRRGHRGIVECHVLRRYRLSDRRDDRVHARVNLKGANPPCPRKKAETRPLPPAFPDTRGEGTSNVNRRKRRSPERREDLAGQSRISV